METAEQIEQNFRAMLDSVWLINSIIANETEGNKETVERNVAHLELMVAKDFWTTEDMTAVHAAIASGKTYVATP